MTDAPLEPQLDESEPEPPLPQDPLLLLQDLDLSIDRLETRRQELEGRGEVGEARRRVEDLEEHVGTLKLALDSIGLEQNRFEHEIETYTQRIDAEATRMYDGSVANPKELLSMRAEIDNLKSQHSGTEDELLGQMERREEIEARMSPLETELLEAGTGWASSAGRPPPSSRISAPPWSPAGRSARPRPRRSRRSCSSSTRSSAPRRRAWARRRWSPRSAWPVTRSSRRSSTSR